jgi:hypothetical protein
MCLVVIAAVQGHLRPSDRSTRGDPAHHLLKAAQPAVQLGCETHLLAEQSGETAAAQAGIARHLQNAARVRIAPEFSVCVAHSAMQFRHVSQASLQVGFQKAQPRGRTSSFQ